MQHHAGRPTPRPMWRFTADPPFTARHLAAQMALLELLARKDLSLEMITQMEKEAIFEARRAFAEALLSTGAEAVPALFAQLTADQVDMVIEATWNALRASMQRQSAQGEVPFPLEDGPYLKNGAEPPPGYFINDAGHLMKTELTDDQIPF